MSNGLTRIEQEDILNRIEEQFDQGVNKLNDKDCYLLEVGVETLWSKRGSTNKYWLCAIESARRAARLTTTNEGPQDDDENPRQRRRGNSVTPPRLRRQQQTNPTSHTEAYDTNQQGSEEVEEIRPKRRRRCNPITARTERYHRQWIPKTLRRAVRACRRVSC